MAKSMAAKKRRTMSIFMQFISSWGITFSVCPGNISVDRTILNTYKITNNHFCIGNHQASCIIQWRGRACAEYPAQAASAAHLQETRSKERTFMTLQRKRLMCLGVLWKAAALPWGEGKCPLLLQLWKKESYRLKFVIKTHDL